MNENQTKEIVNRLEHFLSKDMPPKELKERLNDLFSEVAILAIRSQEGNVDCSFYISDGMYYLRTIVEILDIDKEYNFCGSNEQKDLK